MVAVLYIAVCLHASHDVVWSPAWCTCMRPAMGLDGLFFNTRRLIYHLAVTIDTIKDATPLKETPCPA